MTTANQITPGMTLNFDGKIYRVESSVKVTAAKGTPFVKTKLRNLITDETIEKNFKLDQTVQEVSLIERFLEFLYPEGKEYLFLDIGNLEQVEVPATILAEKVHYLKEGIQLKAMFYGDTIFAVELPQFLEIMVVKTDGTDAIASSASTKIAVLETGAKIDVPLFIESGDVVKVDTQTNDFIQRV
ncbi:MAG: elongation factor P [Chlamydiae bacterium CG10_big_fil_rev_8_21_14_0_10_42_34]|nr:MAG: elongation factor P [Chlamydiae bacterium CG10_big_fil_rev_8_21_14_0_10_42_34]